MNISELVPDDTPDYMVHAWIDCLTWAIGQPEILASFRRETGNHWTPGRSPLERMIDQSTGVEEATIKAFILWANVNIWGPIDGDPDFDAEAES